ncbi:MAG: PqqD family protein [bacterium]
MTGKYVSRNENTASRVIDGQAIIMTLGDNTLHTLNDVGSRIWNLCGDQKAIEEIITVIHEEYAASYEEIKADCESFIEEMCTKGILTLQDEKAVGEGSGVGR